MGCTEFSGGTRAKTASNRAFHSNGASTTLLSYDRRFSFFGSCEWPIARWLGTCTGTVVIDLWEPVLSAVVILTQQKHRGLEPRPRCFL
jgi:hypothetical protein